MPAERGRIVLERQYSVAEYGCLTEGHIPEGQDDRWFIWVGDDDRVHIHRSWTGFEIYEVQLHPSGGGYEVAEVWVNTDPEQHQRDPRVDAAILGPMLDSLAGR
jgi:hypothetical protein